MKNLFLFLLMVTFCATQAQTIKVTVVGNPDSTVMVSFPTGDVNYFFWKNGSPKALDKNRTAVFANTLSKPSNVFVVSGKRFENVFVEPGESMEVKIDYSAKQKVVSFTGKNAGGNLLLNKLNHPFYQYKANHYFKQDSAVAAVKAAVLRDMQKELAPMDSLLKLKQITPAFYKYASVEIRYYYAAVYGAAVFIQYARGSFPKGHREYKATMDPEYEKAWPEVFRLFPVHDPDAVMASDFYDYVRDYISWYKAVYLKEKSGVKRLITKDNHHEIYFAEINRTFGGLTQEYLLAHYLFNEAMERDYNQQLVKLYDYFTKRYPESKYTTFLTPLINESIAFHAKSKNELNAEEQVLDRNAYTSFDALLKNYKDKTVYVDLWATWCAPCKEEFAFGKELKSYLKSKNIAMLYISMDRDDADEQWKNMIKFYGLTGEHIRVSPSLQKDIINRFYDGKSYSIPRYMIIKNGKILNDAAMQPSDKEKLYKQIESFVEAK